MRQLKILVLASLSLLSWQVKSQMAVTLLLPPTGLVQKQQLWSVLVTNQSLTAQNIRVEILMTEISTGQPVLSATSGLILIPSGTKQLTATTVGPVQYVGTNPNYRINTSPDGLLPIGSFNVCYGFWQSDRIIAQECRSVAIEPLSPLQLTFPVQHAALENANPNFTWIPFSSMQSVASLTYAMKLVEVLPGQNATGAMVDNPALFAASQISTNSSLFYGPSFPALKRNQLYAWQVTAMNGLAEIAKSETWDFSIGEGQRLGKGQGDPVYVKLKKTPEEAGYCIFYGSLCFEYLNETSDTSWNVKFIDIGATNKTPTSLKALDTLRMKGGENLIKLPTDKIDGLLQDKHIYLMELINSRQERWQVKFEYRKEDE